MYSCALTRMFNTTHQVNFCVFVLSLTDDGWSQYGCDSLEKEKETESVSQFVQPQEVD